MVISSNVSKKQASVFGTAFTPGWLALGTQQTLLKFPGTQANMAEKLQRCVIKAMSMEKQIQILCLEALYLLTFPSIYSDSVSNR